MEQGDLVGCVVEDRGVPTAVYSAVADQGARSVVLLARSDAEMQTIVDPKEADDVREACKVMRPVFDVAYSSGITETYLLPA